MRVFGVENPDSAYPSERRRIHTAEIAEQDQKIHTLGRLTAMLEEVRLESYAEMSDDLRTEGV